MKKFLVGIAAAAIITIPMTSFALESMSKGALKKATGQAGVSIALDNIVIVQKSQPTTIYWDMDGTSSIGGTVGKVQSAGLSIAYGNLAEKLVILDGILDDSKYGTQKIEDTFHLSTADAKFGITSAGIVATGTVTDASNGVVANAAGAYGRGISPLTIDVGTCQSLSAGLHYNMGADALDVAGVVIGLPTIEITTFHSNDTKIVSVVSGTPAQTANSGATVPHVSNEFIRIEKTGTSQMAILGGRLEIAPH